MGYSISRDDSTNPRDFLHSFFRAVICAFRSRISKDPRPILSRPLISTPGDGQARILYVALPVLFFSLLPSNSFSLAQAASQQSNTVLYQEAQKAMEAGDYDRAIRNYQQLIRVDSKSAVLWLQLGLAQYQKADYSAAAATLRRALDLQPAFPVVEAFLGLSEAAQGHSDLSLPFLEKSFHSTDPAINHELKRLIGTQLAKIYSKKGRSIEAQFVYLGLLKDNPDDADVLYKSFWLDMTSAHELLRKLVRNHPNSYRTHQMLGFLLKEKQNYSAAAEEFRLALKVNPRAPGLHTELGKMLALSSGPEGQQAAVKEFEEELRLNPFHPESHYQLAEIALENDQSDRAEELFSKALALDPDFSDAAAGLCQIYMSKNHLQEALRQCEKAVQLDPANRSAHYRLSRVFQKLGQVEDAAREMAIFEKLKNEARTESAYFSRAETGMSSGRTETQGEPRPQD